MFKKQQRLIGKEVRFLTKKRQVFSQGLFTLFYVEQYPNRKYHQFSFHIPLIVSKRAVKRHKIKRILLDNLNIHLKNMYFGEKFYKGFITLHKTKTKQLIKLIEDKNWPGITQYLQAENKQFFTSFSNFISGRKTQQKKNQQQ